MRDMVRLFAAVVVAVLLTVASLGAQADRIALPMTGFQKSYSEAGFAAVQARFLEGGYEVSTLPNGLVVSRMGKGEEGHGLLGVQWEAHEIWTIPYQKTEDGYAISPPLLDYQEKAPFFGGWRPAELSANRYVEFYGHLEAVPIAAIISDAPADAPPDPATEPDAPADAPPDQATEPHAPTDASPDPATEPDAPADVPPDPATEPDAPADAPPDPATEPHAPTDASPDAATEPDESADPRSNEEPTEEPTDDRR